MVNLVFVTVDTSNLLASRAGSGSLGRSDSVSLDPGLVQRIVRRMREDRLDAIQSRRGLAPAEPEVLPVESRQHGCTDALRSAG
jgi:hypothetical protein